jgi:hypothetical protein
MGHCAGLNVHQTILKNLVKGYEPKFTELNEFPPVIGLAVGKKAVASSVDGGTVYGEDVMQAYFRDDLALTSTCHTLPTSNLMIPGLSLARFMLTS